MVSLTSMIAAMLPAAITHHSMLCILAAAGDEHSDYRTSTFGWPGSLWVAQLDSAQCMRHNCCNQPRVQPPSTAIHTTEPTAAIAVVWRAEDGDHVLLVAPVVALHDQLVRARDQVEPVRVIELRRQKHRTVSTGSAIATQVSGSGSLADSLQHAVVAETAGGLLKVPQPAR